MSDLLLIFGFWVLGSVLVGLFAGRVLARLRVHQEEP